MMYNIKLTLDNKKVIDINGLISYENMSIIGDHIFYNIEIDKNDIEILISNGLSVCKHYNKDCTRSFNGTLTKEYNISYHWFSPDRETKRKYVWVTKQDDKLYNVDPKNFGTLSDLRDRRINEILE